MNRPETRCEEDPLAPARGLLIGLAISLGGLVIVITAWWMGGGA